MWSETITNPNLEAQQWQNWKFEKVFVFTSFPRVISMSELPQREEDSKLSLNSPLVTWKWYFTQISKLKSFSQARNVFGKRQKCWLSIFTLEIISCIASNNSLWMKKILGKDMNEFSGSSLYQERDVHLMINTLQIFLGFTSFNSEKTKCNFLQIRVVKDIWKRYKWVVVFESLPTTRSLADC